MKVDIQTLETFNQLAHEGAQRAAASLEQMAGISPTVEATAIDLASPEDVFTDFKGREFVGVAIEFSDALSGQALIVFDRGGARTLAKNLTGNEPAPEEDVRPYVEEVGNILISGFIDGWADHLNAAIDISPPTTVAGAGVEVIPEDAPIYEHAEQALSFTSLLETTEAAVNASVYLFPERRSFTEMAAENLDDSTAPIPLDKLQAFNQMAERGTEQASQNITMMTGAETTVEVSRLRFLPVEQVAGQLGDERWVGLVVALEGLPSGYLVILFDVDSAGTIAEQLGADPVEGEFEMMHQSALEELGNVMSSGFIDGWANVLETSITHTPPEFVHDYATAIMDPVVNRLAANQRYAFVFDSLIQRTDQAVSCEIFALPDEAELREALEELELDAETAADDEALAEAMEADPSDLF